MKLRFLFGVLRYLASITGKSYDRVSDDLEEKPKVTVYTIGLLFLIAIGIILLAMASAFGGIAIWYEFNKKEADFYLRCGGYGDRDPACGEVPKLPQASP